MKAKKAHIMVVAAHPDDPEFGAAGTLVKWIQKGKQVVYVICTSGEKGTSDPTIKPEDLAKLREEEQLAAAKVLGVREVVFLRHHDQTLEDTPEFRKEIVRYIRMYRPDTVLTSDPYRKYIWHRDHRICGVVTLDAIFPFARDYWSYPDLADEGLKPHKVKEVLLWGTMEEKDITFRSDITDIIDIKLNALRCHKSQVGHHFDEVEQWVRRRAQDLAKGTKFKLAEAFHREEIRR